LKYSDKIEWVREFGTVGDWRAEKMGKCPGAKYGYLLSNSEKTYLSVNPGPFESPEDRDAHILKDIYEREANSKSD
tara:strand:- start:793 stop:1020 length:228 start_codon:yes stop_codon:yes gene_type:complete